MSSAQSEALAVRKTPSWSSAAPSGRSRSSRARSGPGGRSHTHSIGGDKVTEVVFEEQVGGRIYERHADGGEGEWGTRARVGAAGAVRDELVPGARRLAGDAARGAVRRRGRRHARRSRAHAAGRSWPRGRRRPASNYDGGWGGVLGYYTRHFEADGLSDRQRRGDRGRRPWRCGALRAPRARLRGVRDQLVRAPSRRTG